MTIFIAAAFFIAGMFWGILLISLLVANHWGEQ